MNFCKYKNIFGKPKEVVHSYRFLNFAIVDVVMTILFAFILSYFLKYSFRYIVLFLFILGIILHRLFCVRTTIDTILFPQ